LNAHFHRPASPPLTRSAQRRRWLGEQPIASQERTTKATSAAGVASVSSSRKRRRVTGAQLAEVCRASEAAASQNSNNNEPAEVEGDEGDLTDVEADFEETTAMAMNDRAVQCRYLFAWNMDRTLALLSQARLHHRKDSTADIKTVFTKAELVREDGTVRSGHWCEICKYVLSYSPIHPCPLESDPWPGKGNMAEKTVRGLQVQRLCSALTFDGTWPIYPQVFQVVRALLTRSP